MDKPFSNNGMEPFSTNDENRRILESTPMNLQLFATDEIDWRRIYETQPPGDFEEGDTFKHTQIFRVPSETAADDPTTDDDLDDDESEIREPIFMPRLSVMDRNLPYLSNGEMVIADEEGNLSTASVDEDGALSTDPLQINGEVIGDDSIPGSKLMENAVTSRELDLEELFSDSALLNQLIAANIDTDDLFLNDQFVAKLTDRITAHPIKSIQIVDGAITRAKIEDAAIGTAQIDDAAITSAKIAEAAIGTAQIGDAAITSAKIEAAAIGTAQIDDAAITSAKIAEAAIGTAQIGDAAITSAKIEAAAIGTAQIDDAAITSAKIADAAIGTAQIDAAAITAAKIADGVITNAKIADATIENGKIQNGTIETAKIALGAITSALIKNGAIGTAQIADGSITDAKIVSLNADVITAGTLSVERLLLKGPDGLFVAINATDEGLTTEKLSEAEYQNRISGSVLVAKSVTADQIAAKTITANEILAGSITGAEIAGETITGLNIKAGTLTTNHVESTFGGMLDLSSNEGINQRVQSIYDDMAVIAEKQVGGTNLMPDTSAVYVEVALGQDHALLGERMELAKLGLAPGDTVTCSMTLRMDAMKSACARITTYLAETGDAGEVVVVSDEVVPPDGEGRSVLTMTIPTTAAYMEVAIQNRTSTATEPSTVLVKRVQLERGETPTDWSPAPEDVASQLETRISEAYSQINTTAESIRQEVSTTYASANALSQITQQVTTLAEQTAGRFTWEASISSKVAELDGGQDSNAADIELIKNYMTFGTDGLVLGKSGNPITLRVINDRVAFFMNDSEVAYFSNNKLYVKQAEILTQLQIGKFQFMPQTNGNMSLIYTG